MVKLYFQRLDFETRTRLALGKRRSFATKIGGTGDPLPATQLAKTSPRYLLTGQPVHVGIESKQ